jgi:hypothetical protein
MPDKDQLHRCVRSVTLQAIEDGATPHEAFNRAYPICKGRLLATGYLDPESYRSEAPTPAGRKRIAEMRREPGHQGWLAEYEQLKDASRQRRSRVTSRQRLRGAANQSKSAVLDQALRLRLAMNPVFSCDTVFGDCKWPTYPSAGHCFMAALAAQDVLGGEILYGLVNNIHHYWNRVGKWEVDLTADQFNEAPVRVKRGAIRPHVSVFDRKRYERTNAKSNKEPLTIYDRFRERLVPELTEQGLTEYIPHIQRMP